MRPPHTSPDWYRVEELRPRLRPDARVARHVYLGRPWYVLTDTTGGKVHRMTPSAYAVAAGFDGSASIGEVWRKVVDEHGEDAPTQDEIIKLLAQLHGADLLTGEDRPLVGELLERGDKERMQKIRKLLLNPLGMTIPLLDPHRFLIVLARAFAVLPCFVWWSIAFGTIATAAFLAIVNWSRLAERGIDGVLDLENLLAIALIYPVVKAIHEIGHGLAIRSRGGEVHEMGVVLVAFYPIPYVEGSASLFFPSKWDRMAVAGAGIVAELLICSIALFVWLAAEPGTLRSVAFNTMLITGFSTLAINGNPLLKFDGYHVLADLIEIPTLARKGNEWWGEWARINLLGTREPERAPVTAWERFWFIIYPPAAYVYRIAIALTIALFVATAYLTIGVILAAWSLLLGVGLPLWKVTRAAFTNQRIRQAGARAPLAAGAVALLLAVALFAVPFPHRAITEGVVWLPPEAQVRASATGVLRGVDVRHDDTVGKGDRIAVLSAPERDAALARARAQLAAAQVAHGAVRFVDRARGQVLLEDVRVAEAALVDARSRLDDLAVTASGSGRFDLPQAADLEGRFVREGELIAHILPQGRRTVRMVVRQADVGLVRDRLVGIDLRFADEIAVVHSARLVREVPAGAFAVPSRALSIDGGGRIATAPDADGTPRAMARLFQFDLETEAADARTPPFGMRAKIRLVFQPMPVGLQAARQVRQVFLSAFAR